MSSKLSGIKGYLTFSKGERNGIIILLILMILLMLVPILHRSFVSNTPSNNYEFYEKADSFFSSLAIKIDEMVMLESISIEKEEVRGAKGRRYFFFDPNTIKVDELIQLGLSVKQANVIEKYRSKGGRFHTIEEFSKVYVIDSFTFQNLKPWIKIDTLNFRLQPKVKRDSLPRLNKPPIIVELNSADTIELNKIKGIGKVYARRIVAYRNLLGGYVNIHQLTEVYGIKPELMNSISSSITIDTSRIQKINLNLVSYEDLKKHPYLSEYQAKSIIFYRNRVGNIKNINELMVNKILPIEKYQRFKNYITTN